MKGYFEMKNFFACIAVLIAFSVMSCGALSKAPNVVEDVMKSWDGAACSFACDKQDVVGKELCSDICVLMVGMVLDEVTEFVHDEGSENLYKIADEGVETLCRISCGKQDCVDYEVCVGVCTYASLESMDQAKRLIDEKQVK